jgi:hypothetical protein
MDLLIVIKLEMIPKLCSMVRHIYTAFSKISSYPVLGSVHCWSHGRNVNLTMHVCLHIFACPPVDSTVRWFSTGKHRRLAELDAMLFGRNGQRFREIIPPPSSHRFFLCREDGGSTLLRNVDRFALDYHYDHGNCPVSRPASCFT